MLQPLRSGLNLIKIPVWRVYSEMEVQKLYAIIETGGKQLKVTEGQEIFVEKLNVETDDVVTFDHVLFVGGEDVKVGTPYVDGASVTAKVDKHGRGKKSTVFKYNRKQRHHQHYTKLVINKIHA